jgi:hypothetical protein
MTESTPTPKPPRKPRTPRPPRAKVPATPGARRLLPKLEFLAARPGTPDEGEAAKKKLARLLAKYDFKAPDASREELFSGGFEPDPTARPVLSCRDWALMSAVQWAIEQSTGLRCLIRGDQLLACTTPKTAAKLEAIGRTISEGFAALWGKFSAFPAVSPADRPLFLRGMYDGMMNEQKPEGERLPARVAVKMPRAKRNAVALPSGIGLHPYTVALDLGRQIRFNAPLPEVINQLEAMDPKRIHA